jgi:catechol 2,3-dioxygenase
MARNEGKERANIRATLTHAGIWVWDLKKMESFYTRILGLSVSDRGYVKRYGGNIVFLSSDPKIHHQVILCEGRPPNAPSTVNQLSFTVASLGELKEMHRRVVAEGIEALPRNHGNAWSIYFDDPEGNNVEVYLDSPFHVPQPYGEPLDLGLSDEEIVRATEELIRGTEGFMAREQWSAKRAREMDQLKTVARSDKP